jgi:VIT1/CCC1 family predicted Fe2+/Mn2+ transporter
MHHEGHGRDRVGWLRAGVLGANDGIVSTASLVLGYAATGAGQHAVGLAGLAGLVAGAMSMAAGEYVSVRSQVDAERADIARERKELVTQPDEEHIELRRIYEARGLDRATADEVARQLAAHDALAAHLRDELGIHEATRARPLQAAWVSALSFAVGAAVPLLLILLLGVGSAVLVTAAVSVGALASLGAFAARLGGAPPWPAALRLVVAGTLALAVTWAIGHAAGVTLG